MNNNPNPTTQSHCYAASKFVVESSIWYTLYQQIPN